MGERIEVDFSKKILTLYNIRINAKLRLFFCFCLHADIVQPILINFGSGIDRPLRILYRLLFCEKLF